MLFLCIASTPQAQNLQGYVRNKTTQEPIEHIILKTEAVNDTAKKQIALTDVNGAYLLHNPLATSANSVFAFNDELKITFHNKTHLSIHIKTDDAVERIHFFGITGQQIATEKLHKTAEQEYEANMYLPKQAGSQIFILSDEVHKGVKIFPAATQKIHPMTSSHRMNGLPLKAASLADNAINIRIEEPEGQDHYQPFDTIFLMDIANENYRDFYLNPWPTFNAKIGLKLLSEKGEVVANATVTLTQKDKQNTYEATTNQNGEANIDVVIPHYATDKRIPDTLAFTLNATAEAYENFGVDIKGITNRDTSLTFNGLIEIVPEQQYAQLRRYFAPKQLENGTTTNIIVTNKEQEFQDTVFEIGVNSLWILDVPVNNTGTTKYALNYEPQVREGEIPLFDRTINIDLSPNMVARGTDSIYALAQEQKVNLSFTYSDTKELAKGIDIVIYDADGKQVDSIRNHTGKLQIGPYQVGRNRLTLNAHLINDKKNDYFSHEGIPIGDANADPGMGQVNIENYKLTIMADSVTNHTVELQKNEWKDPLTGEMLLLNPEHLRRLEGSSYNIGWVLWGEQQMYLTPRSTNTAWPVEFGAFVERNTGIPYKVKIVDTPFDMTNAVVIKSLDDKEYLESVRDKIGINVESRLDNAGYTQAGGYSTIDGIQVHTTGDIEIRAPPEGMKAGSYGIASTAREFFTRYEKLNEISKEYYKSFSNLTTPKDLDSTKMIYDFANIAVIYHHYMARINKKSHSGFATLVPSEDSLFYDKNIHNSDDFKGWDTPENCPEQNKKFFDF